MILLRQIYYDPKQIPLLEKDVEYFFNDGKVAAQEREFGIMRYFYLRNELFGENDEFSGFISWKFREKARIPAQFFIDSVQSRPGADVYILNPFPEQVLYWNAWHHAEAHHPGIIFMVNKLIKAVGLPWDILKTPNILNNASFCNFWVGNRKFWDLYMGYGLKFYDKIISDPELNNYFFRAAPGGNLKAPYFSFFFERLITEILAHHPEIKVKGFRYSREWLKIHYREDVADFLYALPQQGDLNFMEGEIDGAVFADYRRQLLTDASFFRPQDSYGRIMGFFDRHPLLRRLLNNPATRWLKRLIFHRDGKAPIDLGEIFLR